MPSRRCAGKGPNLIGRPYKFEVEHIIEVLDQFRAEGKLKTKGEKDHARITFHDPCQVNRRGGIIKEPRNLLNMVADNFVETEDAGAMNWCCSGGGGVGANQRANELQAEGLQPQEEADRGRRPREDRHHVRLLPYDAGRPAGNQRAWTTSKSPGLTEMMAEYLEEIEGERK